MELGKHLTKGIWGLADKALPVAYGVGYVILVIRVLPEEEFGNFVLIQEIFLIISALATAFALQPLLKFGSENAAQDRDVNSATMLLNAVFVLVASIVFLVGGTPLAVLLRAPSLGPLMVFIPIMLAASFIRNFTLMLLQAKFQIKQVFWTDAVHFLGAPILTWIMSRMHLFSTAVDLLYINTISLSASSVVGLFLSRRVLVMRLVPAPAMMRRVWDYGKFSLGGIISYLVYSKGDTFIVSAVGGPIQVAIYSSAKVFVRVFEMVGQVLQMFLLPATSRLSSLGESASLTSLSHKSILFSTLSMLPVFVLFLFLPGIWIGILYGAKYPEAVPLLQIFSFLSFIVPLMAVETNILMGLGHVRLSFIIGIQMLLIAVTAYVVFIPLWGSEGAAIGYVAATALTTWILVRRTNAYVPVTFAGVLRRWSDLSAFVRSRL